MDGNMTGSCVTLTSAMEAVRVLNFNELFNGHHARVTLPKGKKTDNRCRKMSRLIDYP